jgi:TP901 family phage tail tape measure protein
VAAQTGPLRSKSGKLGKAIGLGIGAGVVAAGAVGTALFKVGQEFDTAYDKIRTQTGAGGRELGRLKESFKDVVSDVPVDFDTASTAIAGLNQRLGLTGRPLRKVTKQLTELSRITGTDIQENVEATTRLFGDWSIKTGQQTRALDKLFRVSQETGITVSDLSRLMVKFGSPLRQLGLDFDTAAAMFARFEREGVNVQTLMPGLRFGLKTLSGATPEVTAELKKLGVSVKDPSLALQQIFKLIERAPSDLKANALAFKVFGVRAGPDMAAAIREGRFELDDLIQTMQKGDDTIRRSGRQTMDFSEHWQRFTNNLKVAVEPVAVDVFEGIGDAMEDVTKIATDKKLTREEKFSKLMDMLTDAVADAAPKVAQAGLKVGGALIRGVFRGFIHSDLLGKLFIGAAVFRLVAGRGAILAAGRLIGRALGLGIASGTVSTAAGGAAGGTGIVGGLSTRLKTAAKRLGGAVVATGVVSGAIEAMQSGGLQRDFGDVATDFFSGATFGALPSSKDLAGEIAGNWEDAIRAISSSRFEGVTFGFGPEGLLADAIGTGVPDKVSRSIETVAERLAVLREIRGDLIPIAEAEGRLNEDAADALRKLTRQQEAAVREINNVPAAFYSIRQVLQDPELLNSESLVRSVVKPLRRMAPDARQATVNMLQEWARTLRGRGDLAKGEFRRFMAALAVATGRGGRRVGNRWRDMWDALADKTATGKEQIEAAFGTEEWARFLGTDVWKGVRGDWRQRFRELAGDTKWGSRQIWQAFLSEGGFENLSGLNVPGVSRRGRGARAGRRQHGGPVDRNRPYLVGEDGPELFVPRRGGRIVPRRRRRGAGWFDLGLEDQAKQAEGPARRIRGVLGSIFQASDRVGKTSRKALDEHFRGLDKDVVHTTTGMRRRVGDLFDKTRRQATDTSKKLRDGVGDDFRSTARVAIERTRRARSDVSTDFVRMRSKSVGESDEMQRDVGGNFRDLVGTVGDGLSRIARMTNKALGALGVKKVDFRLGASDRGGGRAERRQRGGPIDVPGSGSGDTVPLHIDGRLAAFVEPREKVGVMNRVAAKAWDAWNARFPRFGGKVPGFARGGWVGDSPVGLNPAIRSVGLWAMRRYGASASDTVAPRAGSSWHPVGAAVDLVSSNMLRMAKGIANAFGPRLEELIYTPLGFSISGGQRVAPYAQEDHYDHVHVAALGKAIAGAVFKEIPRQVLQGPKGPLRSLGQAALDRTRAAANKFLRRQMPMGGDVGGATLFRGGGRFISTAYGPPWGGIQGTGTTYTGIDLSRGQKAFIVAVDPDVIPLHSKLRISPNPFDHRGAFAAEDIGGAIQGRRIDFYDWLGRGHQLAWGTQPVRVKGFKKGGVMPFGGYFDHGGTVPGRPGQKVLIVAHGGEDVVKRQRGGEIEPPGGLKRLKREAKELRVMLRMAERRLETHLTEGQRDRLKKLTKIARRDDERREKIKRRLEAADLSKQERRRLREKLESVDRLTPKQERELKRLREQRQDHPRLTREERRERRRLRRELSPGQLERMKRRFAEDGKLSKEEKAKLKALEEDRDRLQELNKQQRQHHRERELERDLRQRIKKLEGKADATDELISQNKALTQEINALAERLEVIAANSKGLIGLLGNEAAAGIGSRSKQKARLAWAGSTRTY